jgi:hypothetical protein
VKEKIHNVVDMHCKKNGWSKLGLLTVSGRRIMYNEVSFYSSFLSPPTEFDPLNAKLNKISNFGVSKKNKDWMRSIKADYKVTASQPILWCLLPRPTCVIIPALLWPLTSKPSTTWLNVRILCCKSVQSGSVVRNQLFELHNKVASFIMKVVRISA